MSTPMLLEAAVRSLVMGAIVLLALRLLRIEQVQARRTAWLLALLGALAMPMLVGAHIGPRLLPQLALQGSSHIAAPYPRSAAPLGDEAPVTVAALHAIERPLPLVADEDGAAGGQLTNTALSLLVMGYCMVAAVLTLRLCAGVGFALRLRNQAPRVIFPFDPQLDVRESSRISAPVTIASSVLLPLSRTSWDEATLRVVLSHERAHVRQGDFYVQALAGLHCALFWFNPFSWWLQRQLAELGEALSDRAAVEQADSRASYAETLLAFATRARWPLAEVAMASTSNLAPRIERLLNDRGFERSFSGKQRLPVVAAGVAILALTAATSTVRVHAAAAAAAASADRDASAALPAPVTPTPSSAQPSPAAPSAAPAPVPAPSPVPAPPPAAPIAPSADAGEGILAIHSGGSRIMIDSGKLLPAQSGDYIYFQHDGEPYVLRDPAIIAQTQALLAPMKELREKQEELGNQQAMLGVQQRMLGTAQKSAKMVDTPEFKREMAELQKAVKQMDLKDLAVQIDQKALAEVAAHLGEIQARVGALQAELGVQLEMFGEQQGKMGEQQAKLGEQQRLLAVQQRKIIENVKQQLKPIIEQAIREGKAKPLGN